MALRNLLGLQEADGHPDARSLEESAYLQAKSKDEYQDLCARIIASLQDPEKPKVDVPIEQEDVRSEHLDDSGPNIGRFKRSTFHRDGQMSCIYKAEAIISATEPGPSNELVALKVTTPSMMTAPHNSEKESRVLLEACHENVVPLLETFWEPGGRFVLVFPFMNYDLETLLRQGILSNAQGLQIIRGLFRALAHIHSLGVIHRDVKPSNILLKSRDGPVYLADFGIAWSPHDEDSEPVDNKITEVGTTSYRPPELLFGHKAYDKSLDIWAAGCVVAEIMKPDHQPVFDAGPLGSELGLIRSMFSTLGTPTEAIWPSARLYPDWGKMRFHDYPARQWNDILQGATSSAIDFVAQTIRYESTHRLTAEQALRHVLLSEI